MSLQSDRERKERMMWRERERLEAQIRKIQRGGGGQERQEEGVGDWEKEGRK